MANRIFLWLTFLFLRIFLRTTSQTKSWTWLIKTYTMGKRTYLEFTVIWMKFVIGRNVLVWGGNSWGFQMCGTTCASLQMHMPFPKQLKHVYPRKSAKKLENLLFSLNTAPSSLSNLCQTMCQTKQNSQQTWSQAHVKKTRKTLCCTLSNGNISAKG